ncbi:MAG TPA: hypothetical protein EYN61_07300 [Chromatiaceae bacterium]|jgi:tetratricopeptide (TPR) repeat protein|nr:hypothetical protein [Chromatiaceae bacterium]
MSNTDSLTPLKALTLLGAPALLLIALYFPSLDYEFVWMDIPEIKEGNLILPEYDYVNAFFRPLHVTQSGRSDTSQNPYYRPLQLLMVSSIYHRVGLTPRYYRASAIAIGAAYSALFAFLAWLLFRRFIPALAASLILVAHPFSIESFAWISAIAEGAAAFWIVASLILALLAMGEADKKRALRYVIGSCLCMVVALLFKEKSVVLPVMSIALLISLRFGRQPQWASLNHKQYADWRDDPAIWLIIIQAFTVFGYLSVWRPMILEIGTAGASLTGSMTTQWLTAIGNWPATMFGFFLPIHPTTSDVTPIYRSFSEPAVWAGALLGVGSFGLWILLLRWRMGIAAFGLAWVWIAFLPTANLVPMIHAHADRYLFLSIGGGALFLVSVIQTLTHSNSQRTQSAVMLGVSIALVAGLSAQTVQRLPDWRSTKTLFTADLARDPNFQEGRFHLARDLYLKGQLNQAAKEIDTLIRIEESELDVLSNINQAGLYQMACNVYMQQNKANYAIAVIESFQVRHPQLANHVGAMDCYGQALENQGDNDRAQAIYLGIIDRLQSNPPAGLSLALARTYITQGNTIKSLVWLRKAKSSGLGNDFLRREARRISKLIGQGRL